MKTSGQDNLVGLIEQLNDEGWLISDLYQTSTTNWNCVLRKEGHMSTAYGSDMGPLDALVNAMGNRTKPVNWMRVKRGQEVKTNSKRERLPTKTHRERL